MPQKKEPRGDILDFGSLMLLGSHEDIAVCNSSWASSRQQARLTRRRRGREIVRGSWSAATKMKTRCANIVTFSWRFEFKRLRLGLDRNGKRGDVGGSESQGTASIPGGQVVGDPRKGGTLMAALSSAVSELEAAFIKESEKHGIVAGTTACVAAVTSHTLVVLNLGDSRAILCGMEPADCVRLTRDHHPYWEDERNRIQEAGGSIHSNGKLFGEFEVSRAIGDRDLKAFGMSAVPELTVYDLRQHWPRPLYLLVGSDGIFEKLRFQGVCEVVGNAIRNGACEGIPSKVIDTALQAGTKDNLTLVAVKLI
ncbi:probable protein phosphatase 2C 51 [Selaginella moellendorffii]|uniref:probable protein phosphatase 2C 51 n=1 Tax=Selaginella moellendorffii TaxID=88036 RepID=UPI000D1C6769|nr:probable protein phosphatase 2C 51 [Selaginella moellendorffii]|eukprot:XP_024523159.1 probable protein phosphatase 2C 51 [Selaginella moellendorffii]